MQIISRKDAKALGLKRYFTGKPCKHGHVAERRVARGDCLQCISVSDAKFYSVNSEKVKQYEKVKYDNERESKLEYQRNYRKFNRDKINRRHRNRYDSDELYRMSYIMRKMLRKHVKGVVPSISKLGYSSQQLRDHLESKFEEGMSWDNHGDWHVDHVIPVSILLEMEITDPAVVNGLDNLQPLWAIDNLKKGNRYVG